MVAVTVVIDVPILVKMDEHARAAGGIRAVWLAAEDA